MATPGTITIVRCGGVAEHWRRVIERCEGGDAEVLKAEGGNRVLALRGDSGSAGLVIKRWELRSFSARLKSALRMSRAWRHWKGAERLTKAGVRTATCFAIARSQSTGGVPVEWLIMDRLPGKTLLQHMADGDLTARQEHALAAAAGAMVFTLHDRLLYNRDGKPSNLMVAWPTSESPQIGVIDCVAVRSLSRVDSREEAVFSALANLCIEPLGCRCLPRRTLIARAIIGFIGRLDDTSHRSDGMRTVRRKFWREVAKVIRNHGDPTPKVNPLA